MKDSFKEVLIFENIIVVKDLNSHEDITENCEMKSSILVFLVCPRLLWELDFVKTGTINEVSHVGILPMQLSQWALF